jgi:hypothetical protein
VSIAHVRSGDASAGSAAAPVLTPAGLVTVVAPGRYTNPVAGIVFNTVRPVISVVPLFVTVIVYAFASQKFTLEAPATDTLACAEASEGREKRAAAMGAMRTRKRECMGKLLLRNRMKCGAG